MKKEFLKRTVTGFFFVISLLGTLLLLPSWIFVLLLSLIATTIICLELVRLAPLFSYQYWLLMLGYILLPFSLMAFMALNQTYKPYLLFSFIVAFFHDTAAYLGGKAFGRHKLIPSISPHKTWEGFFCGFLATLFAVQYAQNHLIAPLYLIKTAIFSLFLACSATLGDLFESFLKRKAHIKDASDVLPGHGGFLDRFDSIIALTPIIFAFSLFFKQ